MDQQFYSTPCNECNCWSMMKLKLNLANKGFLGSTYSFTGACVVLSDGFCRVIKPVVFALLFPFSGTNNRYASRNGLRLEIHRCSFMSPTVRFWYSADTVLIPLPALVNIEKWLWYRNHTHTHIYILYLFEKLWTLFYYNKTFCCMWYEVFCDSISAIVVAVIYTV